MALIGWFVIAAVIYCGYSFDRVWPKGAASIVAAAALLTVLAYLAFISDPWRRAAGFEAWLPSLPANLLMKLLLVGIWFFAARGVRWIVTRAKARKAG